MRTALLIGIDYFDTKIATNYNTHDVKRIESDLLPGYDSVCAMTDDLDSGDALYPNYENILHALEGFVGDDADAHYLFVFCGCSRDRYDKIKDEGGDCLPQKERVVSAILPRGKGTEVIDSAKLRECLIDRLPASASLTCIFSANYGHQLLPTRFPYNLKKGTYGPDCEMYGESDKNVIVLSFSSDEFAPVEMKLTAPDKPAIFGSLGIFALIGLVQDCEKFSGDIPLNGWAQVLLKKLVANNPSKIKTYEMYTLGSEDENARKDFFIL